MKSTRGLTLLELMIVLAILGALAAFAGASLNTADAQLRSFVFNLCSRFKQARHEAVMRGSAVYLDFDLDDNKIPDNGYMLWVDVDGDSEFKTEKGDYKLGSDETFPSPGPEVYNLEDNHYRESPKDPKVGPRSYKIGKGISAGRPRFKFDPGGDSSDGTIYVCYSVDAADGKVVVAGPWAIIVDKVGRIRVYEWRNGKWQVG